MAEESHQLLAWFRAIYEEGNRAWNEGDFRRAYGALPDDVAYYLGPMWPEARPLRGPDEIAAFFEDWAEAFPNTHTEIREFVSVGERVVVMGIEVSGTGGRSGAATEMEIWQVWEVREDLRPARVTEFATREEALGVGNASAEALTR